MVLKPVKTLGGGREGMAAWFFKAWPWHARLLI
jgi:hypothetical protein